MRLKVFLILFAVTGTLVYLSSCQSEAQLEYDRYYSAGLLLYQAGCQNCHGSKGEGLGALIPPLTDSDYIKNSNHTLACYIKYGLTTPVTVNNKTYTGQMPALPNLTSIETAEILTYVDNSFGNKNGLIGVQQIDADLKKCE